MWSNNVPDLLVKIKTFVKKWVLYALVIRQPSALFKNNCCGSSQIIMCPISDHSDYKWQLHTIFPGDIYHSSVILNLLKNYDWELKKNTYKHFLFFFKIDINMWIFTNLPALTFTI